MSYLKSSRRRQMAAALVVTAIAMLTVCATRSAPSATALTLDHDLPLSVLSKKLSGEWTDPTFSAKPTTAPITAALPPELQSVIDSRFGTGPGVITPTPTGATIDNPAHQVAAVIDGHGLKIDKACLAVQAWGRADHALMPAQAGTVTTTTDRAVVQRTGLHEIITTSSNGLRHDVVVEERPPGAGDLVVEISCQGGRFESKHANGAELVINGRRMTYDRLKVSDADGKELAARMEVVAGVVRVQVYDAGARYPVVVDPTISATGSLVTARSHYTATLLLSGKVLVTGGEGLSSCELYDPSVGTWTATGSLATTRNQHTATLLSSGKVLVTGGTEGLRDFLPLMSCELYDPSVGTWTVTGSLATVRYRHTATVLPTGKVLVTGGYISDMVTLSSCELYDPTAGAWTGTGSLTTGRGFHTATLLSSGEVLVVGGLFNGGYVVSCERYDPSAGTWTVTGSLATARYQHTATSLPTGKVLVAGGGAGYVTCELFDPSSGTWTATGSLAVGRYLHTATLLPSGKVLATGGISGIDGSSLASSELYDPSTGTWAVTSLLAASRFFHTATLLPSGKVLIAGGIGSGSYLASCELFLPDEGTWTSTGSLVTARSAHTATMLSSSKVLVTGGSGNAFGGAPLDSCEFYDPTSGTWNTTGSMATSRLYHTATLLPSGKVLVTGGFNGSTILATCELYDPAVGTWATTGSMTTNRTYHTATLLPSGMVLVTGGANNYTTTSCELYDPTAGTWSAAGSMATERMEHKATLLPSGKVVVTGGYIESSRLGYYSVASCELYDPSTDTWSTTASMASVRRDHNAILLPSGKVLVLGGISDAGTTASCELYDSTAGTWAATGSMSTGRTVHAATILPSGKVLVTGGANGYPALASCELYDPTSESWIEAGTLSVPRYWHTATLLSSGQVLVSSGASDDHSTNLASSEIYGLSNSIVISLPTRDSSWITTLTNLSIAGTADSSNSILAVTYQLSGATSGSGTATGTTAWNFTPTLNLGTTTIIVTAEASDGSLATDTLTVTVTSPPTIAIALPTTGDSWLSTDGGVTIAGTATGSATVTGVTYALSGATSGSGSATGTTSWTFSPTLNPGITIVTMTATDSNNHTGQDAITITRDVADPIIAISSPVSSGTHLTGTAQVTLTGSATDDGGVVSVSYELSGATVASGTATGTTAWSLSTPSLNHGVTTVTITAHDVANRSSVVTLDLLYPTTSEVGTGNSSGSCGFGSGVAALMMFAFLSVMRFRRQPPSAC